MITAVAHGKIILTGEHSVVYGHPAVVLPLPLGIKVELIEKKGDKPTPHIKHILDVFKNKTGKDLSEFGWKITSDLPQNSGLGSSAALSYALLAAAVKHFGLQFSKEEYFDLVQKCEVYAHGTPSGIDAAAVVYGEVMQFQRKEGGIDKTVLASLKIPSFILIQSGKANETTKMMVELAGNNPDKQDIMGRIGEITQKIIKSLGSDNFDVQLITDNELLLEDLGVVGKKAKQMIRKIEAMRGFAKICGAGGVNDGSGVVLVFHPEPMKLLDLSKKESWEIILGGGDNYASN